MKRGRFPHGCPSTYSFNSDRFGIFERAYPFCTPCPPKSASRWTARVGGWTGPSWLANDTVSRALLASRPGNRTLVSPGVLHYRTALHFASPSSHRYRAEARIQASRSLFVDVVQFLLPVYPSGPLNGSTSMSTLRVSTLSTGQGWRLATGLPPWNVHLAPPRKIRRGTTATSSFFPNSCDDCLRHEQRPRCHRQKRRCFARSLVVAQKTPCPCTARCSRQAAHRASGRICQRPEKNGDRLAHS